MDETAGIKRNKRFKRQPRWMTWTSAILFGLMVLAILLRLGLGWCTRRYYEEVDKRFDQTDFPLMVETTSHPTTELPTHIKHEDLLDFDMVEIRDWDRHVYELRDWLDDGAVPDHLSATRSVVNNYADWFQIIQQRRGHPELLWTVENPDDHPYYQPAFLASFAQTLLVGKAQVEVLDGQFADAMKSALDMWTVAKSGLGQCRRWDTVYIRDLKAYVFETTEAVVSAVESGGDVPLDRHDVEVLLAEFLQEEVFIATYRRDLATNRAPTYRGGLQFSSHWSRQDSDCFSGKPEPLSHTIYCWGIRPLWDVIHARALEYHRHLYQVVLMEPWPAVAAQLPDGSDIPPPFDDTFDGTLPYSRIIECYDDLARQRMAAVALAWYLFKQDHGQAPSDLQALVPDYLPQAPQDPWAKLNTTIGYLIDQQPPLLYSVGPNGEPDGQWTFREPGSATAGESDDRLFFLGRPRPPTH